MNTLAFHKQKLASSLVIVLFFGGLFVGSAFAGDTVQLDQFHASQGVACVDCHGDDNQREAVAMMTCLECHNTKDLAAATANVQPTNPHNNRHYGTETDCNYCHHQHRASENFCTPCHLRFDFKVP